MRRSGRQVAADCALQLRPREPVVRERLDVRASGFDLVALRLEKLEDADLHGVVLELGLLDDLLPKRKHHALVVLDALTRRDHPRSGAADLRADLDRERRELALALAQLGPRLRDGRLALVEDRRRELDGGSGLPLAFGLALGLAAEEAVREERRDARKAEKARLRLALLPERREVEPLRHGARLQALSVDLVGRQRGKPPCDLPAGVRGPEAE